MSRTANLTAAAKALLKLLRDRDNQGDTWLILERGKRFGLVLPTGLASRRHEYHGGVSPRTVNQLVQAQLVELGEVGEAPHFAYKTPWHRVRTRKHRLEARQIMLTNRGRADSA